MFTWLFNIVLTLPSWLQIILFVVFLISGFILLIKGADLFVGSASNIAKKLGISALIIGLTLVALGTSLPEASVSITSAISHSADISVGNIVGSNLFNLLVVLGIFAIFKPFAVKGNIVKRDLPIMLLSSILLLIFAFFFSDSSSSILLRWECIVFLFVLVIYMIWNIKTEKTATNTLHNNPNSEIFKCTNETAKKEETIDNNTKTAKQRNMLINLLLLVLGIVFIAVGGEFVTFGAKNIALNLGMSDALVGLTIVAIGTSLPELVTSIVAAKKGENDIALGNVVGSNIINILFVLGVSGTISPLLIGKEIIIDIIIMSVLFIGFFIYIIINKSIGRKFGLLMLMTYFAYLAYIIIRNFA